jgi:hypothetical protein
LKRRFGNEPHPIAYFEFVVGWRVALFHFPIAFQPPGSLANPIFRVITRLRIARGLRFIRLAIAVAPSPDAARMRNTASSSDVHVVSLLTSPSPFGLGQALQKYI